MSDINLKEILSFVDKLVDKSEDIISKYYRNISIIESKQDASPVTAADREVEQEMRKMIKQSYPAHGIQGEEFGIENANADYRWIIDPIDGTASFMIGRPIFGTLLALMHNGDVLAGVINQPITKERWIGVKGKGTTLNGKKASVRKCGSLENAVVCTTGPNYFTENQLFAFSKVALEARYTVYGGDCYNYGLVASGCVDVVVESGLKQHDFLPLKVIIEEAGGIITDWQGKPITEESAGDIVVSGDEIVHRKVLEILK